MCAKSEDGRSESKGVSWRNGQQLPQGYALLFPFWEIRSWVIRGVSSAGGRYLGGSCRTAKDVHRRLEVTFLLV